MEGERPDLRVFTITMVINHLLHGMILQVVLIPLSPQKPRWWPLVLSLVLQPENANRWKVTQAACGGISCVEMWGNIRNNDKEDKDNNSFVASTSSKSSSSKIIVIIIIIIIIIIIKSLEKSKHTVQVKLELPPPWRFFWRFPTKKYKSSPWWFFRGGSHPGCALAGWDPSPWQASP